MDGRWPLLDPSDVTDPALLLSGVYAALALLLLSLNLRSAWPLPIKVVTTGLTLPASLGAFVSIEALLGWPSQAALPEDFQLHAALVEEPASHDAEGGAIYLWVTPFELAETEATPPLQPGLRPRAFDLPYSRDLHKEVDAMRERLARGELVTGKHRPANGRERRFGEQGGEIDLEAPPPPPLPKQEDG